jgi:phosphatidylinositol phosphate synthase
VVTCHPWLAAGVTGFLVVTSIRELGPVLASRSRVGGPTQDGLLGVRLRVWFRQRTEPVAEALLAAGISPTGVTISQLVVGAVCGLAYGRGWVFTAGWLLLASGTFDVLDGAMARKCGVASPRGAFIDSVVDRYGEFVVFLGLAVLYRDGWVLWAVLVALFGSLMVSYARARAEALGAECQVGLVQRPERYVILGGGSIVGVLVAHLTCNPAHGTALLAASIVGVAALASVTALQRIAAALRHLR